MLRPLGSPLPLGFLALAGATLLVAGVQLHWVAPEEERHVALILVAFVVPLQFLACVLGFLARDVVAGTGMGLHSGIWLAVALVSVQSPPASTSRALGIFLLLAAVAMLVPAAGAATGKVVPAAVLATTAFRFLTTGLYEMTGSASWGITAGIIGLVLCALAVYAALGLALEDVPRPSCQCCGTASVAPR